MKYTIIYKEAENKYEMNGILLDFVGEHLYKIATKHNLLDRENFYLESDILSYLYEHGIEVNLLEEDGSRMVW